MELLDNVTMQETLSDWSSYIPEILKNCLNDAQPIGGPVYRFAMFYTGTLKSRERTTRDHQNCGD